jgi:enterochelin esterase-like enzyme
VLHLVDFGWIASDSGTFWWQISNVNDWCKLQYVVARYLVLLMLTQISSSALVLFGRTNSKILNHS